MVAKPEVLAVLRLCVAGDALELDLDDGVRLQSTFASLDEKAGEVVVSVGPLEREISLESIERASVLSEQAPPSE